MNKTTILLWALAGVIVPAVILVDLNLLRGTIADYAPLVLVVWPSSFLMSGFTGWSMASVIGLVISVAINMGLYVSIGFLLSRGWLLISRSG